MLVSQAWPPLSPLSNVGTTTDTIAWTTATSVQIHSAALTRDLIVLCQS